MEFYGSIHNHTDVGSNQRLRDSTNKIDVLCKYAAELEHNFIAITDHESLTNSIAAQEVEAEIRKEKPDFKVIRGNEIYLCRDGLTKENFIKGEDKYYHFILLAKDELGHKQLRILSTRAWLRGFETNRMLRVPTYYSDLIEVVGKEPGHLIASSACLGSRLDQLALIYNETKKEEDYEFMKNWIFQM